MISVPITGEVEARLRARAASMGQDVVEYAAKLLERMSQPPVPLHEISGPLGEEFRQSGMTEDQLADLLEDSKHRMRRVRRGLE
jgi:hypothetical protein